MIGVFDSGIGGLSILKCLRLALPHKSFVYFADSAHAPYGDKSDEALIARSFAVTEELICKYRIQALVIACNTATAAAIHLLRQQYPKLPIVGVEPALKPAATLTQSKSVAVLATRSTLASAKFLALKASLASQTEFICVPCAGLADLIECYASSTATEQEVEQACTGFLAQAGDFDTLVLGCTHYALIASIFHKIVSKKVRIIDNGEAVAKRMGTLLQDIQDIQDMHGTSLQSSNNLTLAGSGNLALLMRAAKRWL